MLGVVAATPLMLSEGGTREVITNVIIGAGVLLLFVFPIVRETLWKARRRREIWLDNPISLTVAPGLLTVETIEYITDLEPDLVKRFWRPDRHLFLKLADGTIIVPRRAFSSDAAWNRFADAADATVRRVAMPEEDAYDGGPPPASRPGLTIVGAEQRVEYTLQEDDFLAWGRFATLQTPGARVQLVALALALVGLLLVSGTSGALLVDALWATPRTERHLFVMPDSGPIIVPRHAFSTDAEWNDFAAAITTLSGGG